MESNQIEAQLEEASMVVQEIIQGDELWDS